MRLIFSATKQQIFLKTISRKYLFIIINLKKINSASDTIPRRKNEDALEFKNQIFRVSSLPHAAPIVELVHGPLVESEKDGVVAEPVVDVPGVRVANKKTHPKKPKKTT